MALQSSSPDIYAQKFNSGMRPKSQILPSVKIITATIFISLYGLICYQMGAQSSYNVSSKTIERPWNQWEAPEHNDDDEEMASRLRRPAAIDDSQLPYKCGLLFFYHIPSTGGVSNFQPLALFEFFSFSLSTTNDIQTW